MARLRIGRFVGCGSRLVFATLLICVAAVSQAAAPGTDALREKYPDYAVALSLLGEEQTAAAIDKLTPLSKSDDPNLAADAAFFLGRALLMEQRHEDALPLFKRLSGQEADQTTHAAEARYLQGACEARLLKRSEAITTWEAFLKKHPDAPERMRVDAERQVADLKQVKDGSIGDIQHHMDYAGRRLGLEDAGRDTRDRQEDIVAMLTKLIDENEKGECSDCESSDCDKPGQCQKPGGQKSGNSSGSKPGSGPGGSTPGGNKQASGDDVSGRSHQSSDRGEFGDIRQRERTERIFSALKSRYPAQYRKLVEQYSKSLQEDRE